MSSSHTSNYNLSQWAASDRVLRTDFNADNAKIDAAIAAVDSRVGGLAATAATSSELARVEQRVDALARTTGQHASALAQKGNCQLYTTSYVGTGTCDWQNPNSLTFPQKPMVVFITSNGNMLILLQGEKTSWSDKLGGGDCTIGADWSGNSVSWSGASTRGQMNDKGRTYLVLALLEAGQ